MKAALWYAPRDIRIEDVPEPSPKAGEVKLKVGRTGICGSDLHEYTTGPHWIQNAPVVMGHEFAGSVVELGPGVQRVAVGDRVCAAGYVLCGRCWYCANGYPILCNDLGAVGMTRHGGLTDYVVLPEYCLFKLPAGIPDDLGAMVEPLSTAVRAVNRTRLRPGETVAVVGAGPMGLGVIMMAKAAGAGRIYAVEKAALRKKIALQVGATEVIDPDECDPVERIFGLTSGLGVDVAFECVGIAPTVATAVRVARKAGRIGLIGVPEAASTIDHGEILLNEKEVIAILGYANEHAAVIELIASGRIDPRPLITDTIRLGEVVEKGFDALLNDKDAHIKILIAPER